MVSMRLCIACASLVFASPARAESVADWRPYVVEASARFGVPVAWIEAVMHAESRGRTTSNGRPIRSSAGAIGLMQLMPPTWVDMRDRLGLGSNPDDPRDNILAGAAYMRELYNEFGAPNFLAAYNLGPVRLARDLRAKRPLPRETRHYLSKLSAVVQNHPPPPCIIDSDGGGE